MLFSWLNFLSVFFFTLFPCLTKITPYTEIRALMQNGYLQSQSLQSLQSFVPDLNYIQLKVGKSAKITYKSDGRKKLPKYTNCPNLIKKMRKIWGHFHQGPSEIICIRTKITSYTEARALISKMNLFMGTCALPRRCRDIFSGLL